MAFLEECLMLWLRSIPDFPPPITHTQQRTAVGGRRPTGLQHLACADPDGEEDVGLAARNPLSEFVRVSAIWELAPCLEPSER